MGIIFSKCRRHNSAADAGDIMQIARGSFRASNRPAARKTEYNSEHSKEHASSLKETKRNNNTNENKYTVLPQPSTSGISNEPRIGSEPTVNTSSEPTVNTGSEPTVLTGSEPTVNTGSKPNVLTGSESIMNIGSEPKVLTGSEPTVNTGSKPNVLTGSEATVNTGSKPNVLTGYEATLNTGSKPNLLTGSEPTVNTGSEPNVLTGSEPTVNTGSKPNVLTGYEPNTSEPIEADTQVVREIHYCQGSSSNFYENLEFGIASELEVNHDPEREEDFEDGSTVEMDDASSVDSEVELASVSGAFTEAAMVQLSKMIVKENDLRNLGIVGLRLPEYIVQAALTNNPRNIQGAAFDVLSHWYKSQPDVETAWFEINYALQRCGNKDLTKDLTEIAQEPRNNFKLSGERLEKLRALTRQSLKEKPFSTTKGKMWTDTPSNIPVDKIYTKLQWVKRSTETFGYVKTAVDDVTQLFDENEVGQPGPVRILAEGQGGIGKSTAMKHLAMTWAKGLLDHLFDFVFHLELKSVQKNLSIPELIVKQHKALKGIVQPSEVKAILDERSGQKVLIILDGHDEYKRGNKYIDKALKKESLRDCWIIVTSRVTKEVTKLRDYMDAVAEITGFDENSVREYCTKYLGSEEKCRELLKMAENSKIVNHNENTIDYGILCVPILLHMVCSLFLRKVSLPKLTTGILSAIAIRCVDSETIRSTGKKSEKDVQIAICNLGRMALGGLFRKDLQQVFDKSEVLQAVGPEAFELGLLMGTESDPTEEEQTQVYSFHHLLLQQFAAAKYIATLHKISIKSYFPTWESIMAHQDVIRFACGLTANNRYPQNVLDFVYETLIDYCCKSPLLCADFLRNNCDAYLRSLCEEVSDYIDMKPLNNRHLNYVVDQHTQVYIPSRYFVFDLDRQSGTGPISYQKDESSLKYSSSANCELISSNSFPETLKLLEEISKDQELVISKLRLSNVKYKGSCELIEKHLNLSSDVKSIVISHCEFPTKTWNHITNQLKDIRELEQMSSLATWDRLISSLEIVSLAGSLTNRSVRDNILSCLPLCRRLERLDLSDIVLTNSLGIIVENPLCFPIIKAMILQRAGLSDTDIFNFFLSLDEGKFRTLESLALNGNNLRGFFQSNKRFLYKLGSLQRLDVSWCNLMSSDVQCLLATIRDGQLPNLRFLEFMPADLTGCLDLILSTVGQGRVTTRNLFLSKLKLTGMLTALLGGVGEGLKVLGLEGCQLNEDDINGLVQTARDGYMTQLTRLDLSHQNLSGHVKGLFMAIGQELIYLNLRNCQLTDDDVRGLIKAGQCGCLLHLETVDLTGNRLTYRLEELLGVLGKNTEYLKLYDTALDESDIRSLCEATHDERFVNLRGIQLGNDNLSGFLGDLLCGSDQCVLPRLELLTIEKSSPNRTDMENLSKAVQSGRLPYLTDLYLRYNHLYTMEHLVENLINSCVQFHQRDINLCVDQNGLSKDFLKRMELRCEGTNTSLK